MSNTSHSFQESLERRLLMAGQLIKDVNASGDVSADPPVLFPLNSGTALFVHDDGVFGEELWRTDGTPGGTQLVKDITAGSAGSGIGPITAAENGTAYFVVRDGTNQSQIWRTDGMAKNTVLVKDFSAAGFTPVTQLTAASSGAFFVMRDPTNGDELWKTDGSEVGTALVQDINPGVAGSVISRLTYVGGGRVMFGALVAGKGVEPFVSDGTNAGTFTLGDLYSLSGSTFPEEFTPISSGVLFLSNTAVAGSQGLWLTDGTVAGTIRLHAHFQEDLPQSSGSNGVRAANLTRVGNGNTAYFTLSSASYERLWKTDGTIAGTGFAANIRENFSTPFTARDLTDVNGTLYFAAAGNSTVSFEPWKSDGTAGGTGVLADIAPGGLYSNPEGFTFANGRVYFSADNNTDGSEVFSSDGTGGGTSMAKDIFVGPESSLAGSFVVLNGQIYFTARDQTNGLAIWTSNGTSADTAIAVDLPGPTQASNPQFIGRASDGDVFFSVENRSTGFLDLWRTDGTDAGTIQLFTGGTLIDVRNSAVVDNTLFFAGTSAEGTALWVSDGTVAGTSLLNATASLPTNLSSANGKLFFSTIGATGTWVSDGTPGGTVLLSGDVSNGQYVPLNGNTYFITGTALKQIASNGQVSTVADIGINTMSPVAANGVLYFAGKDATNGVELWHSDGTPGGTGLLRNLTFSSTSSSPHSFVPWGTGAVFVAYDAIGAAFAIYKTDGTSVGTTQIGTTGSEFDLGFETPRVIGNTIYFLADDATNGIELWASDGNAANTHLVKDIKPGPGDSRIEAMVAGTDGRLYFGADDGVNGRELWSSDGTLAGTRLEQDINPSGASSDPSGMLAASDGKIYFAADDGVHGSEPWFFVPDVAFASIVNRVLIFNGTGTTDAMSLDFNGTSVTANRNGDVLIFELTDFDFVQVGGDAGNDVLTISATGTVAQPLTFNGAAGANALTVQSGAIMLANDVGAANTSMAVTVSSGASLTMTSTEHLASLSISGNASMAANGNRVVVTKELSIVGSASLDLNDNDLVLDYTGASQRAAIQSLINAARSGGTWLGTGLTSTSARNASPRNTTLGVLEASEFHSISGANALFSGESVDDTTVLVKYTYYGDTDFNGVLDFDDYSRIDAGFNNNRTGWLNGDVDANGIIDFDDYSLIDQAFNTQGSALRPALPPLNAKPGKGSGRAR